MKQVCVAADITYAHLAAMF